MSKVISGFPGVGKSYLKKELGDAVADSDSSTFDKSDFPQNYIQHIRMLIAMGKPIILVSSHKEVREALLAAGIPFDVVVPSLECKEEYIERYEKRGSPPAFINLISSNWENWLNEIYDDSRLTKHIIGPGVSLYDLVDTETLEVELSVD